jgi:hypothetical protein
LEISALALIDAKRKPELGPNCQTVRFINAFRQAGQTDNVAIPAPEGIATLIARASSPQPAAG